MSDQEIIADAYLFLFAGHGSPLQFFLVTTSPHLDSRTFFSETTANTLSAALFLLALYPPHQDQLHDEARDAFGYHAVSDASFGAYSSLKYTLAVFEEALRILGPVLVVSKVSVNDTILPAHTYPSDGSPAQATQVVVPKGSLMRLAIAAIHNNRSHFPHLSSFKMAHKKPHSTLPLANFWSDPDEFRPARFLNRRVDGGAQDEACTSLFHLASLRCHKRTTLITGVPFSTGTRGCIGKNFALSMCPPLISLLHTIDCHWDAPSRGSRHSRFNHAAIHR